MPNESLKLFNRLKLIEPRAYFLAITTQPDGMRRVIRHAGLRPEDAMVVSVPHDEVASYLTAADVGLLLREKSPVNEVASPVKFGEYLASGTPVIMSDGIGDYSALTRRERLGLVLDSNWSDDIVTAQLRRFFLDYAAATTEWRSRCRRSADQFLNFSQYVPSMVEVYRHLGGEISNSRSEMALT
jgi:hypothetical protein